MDPFKIKVDDSNNSQIQETLFELGCEWFGATNEVKTLENCWIDVGSNGRLTWSFHGSDEKELNFPQLRDLVVLKRNDVKDANYSLFISTSQPTLELYKTSSDKFYVYAHGHHAWTESFSVGINTPNLKPVQRLSVDQGLISGAEALRALADRMDVQVKTELTNNWYDNTATYSAEEILAEETAETDDYCSMKLFFRLKPQTIKLDLEIPAPYKAKIGGRDDTSFVLNVGRHQYLYQNEDDYTKARNALEAVFDAALGGNNS